MRSNRSLRLLGQPNAARLPAPISVSCYGQKIESSIKFMPGPTIEYKMEVVEIHSAGKVSFVSGEVTFTPYISAASLSKVLVGTEMKDNAAVFVPVGASLAIKFEKDQIELKATEKPQLFVFKLQ